MYGGGGIYTKSPQSGNPESGMLAQVSPATGGVLGTWKIKFISIPPDKLLLRITRRPTSPCRPIMPPCCRKSRRRPPRSVCLSGWAGEQQRCDEPGVRLFQLLHYRHTRCVQRKLLTDTVLDTTNNWALPGSAPLGTFVLPAADAGGLWLNWTLPDSGFSLESSSTLSGGGVAWASPTAGPASGWWRQEHSAPPANCPPAMPRSSASSSRPLRNCKSSCPV